MFLSLNKIIKWLIIFLIIEVVLLAMGFFFEKKEKTKPPLRHYIFTIQNPTQSVSSKSIASLKKEKSIVKAENNLPLQDTISSMKKIENPFRMVSLKTDRDVLSIKNQKVEPICYINTIALGDLSIKKKKETFINMMIPSILLAKYKMKMERKKVIRLSKNSHLSKEDTLWLSKKLEQFKVSNTDELYKNMELHPTSLIIAQAIVESGWGTSNFFKNANNVFGIWSFSKKDKRLVASKKRGKNAVYLKKYESIHESIYDYLLTISKVSQYKSFRERRLETQDPFILIEHLDKYSEQGDEYIANIKNIMKKNKLLQYDSYTLQL